MGANRLRQFLAAFCPLVEEVSNPELGRNIEQLRDPGTVEQVHQSHAWRRLVGPVGIIRCRH